MFSKFNKCIWATGRLENKRRSKFEYEYNKIHTSYIILQFLHVPICVNRAIRRSSEIDGSRLPTYLFRNEIKRLQKFLSKIYLQSSTI